MDKFYINVQHLLEDSFTLAMQVFQSGYQPDYIVGIWRGGAPVGIAVQELLEYLGVRSDHIAIRTSSYTGIGQRSQTVKVHGLSYITDRIAPGESVLLVDDVYDTGLSLAQVVADLERACSAHRPEIRIATPWYKPSNNLTDRIPDYYVHESNQWLVFPHELNGLTLDEIQRHKPELSKFILALELSRKPTD